MERAHRSYIYDVLSLTSCGVTLFLTLQNIIDFSTIHASHFFELKHLNIIYHLISLPYLSVVYVWQRIHVIGYMRDIRDKQIVLAAIGSHLSDSSALFGFR